MFHNMPSIDAIIFIVFLIFNFTLGLFSSRGIKNIKEYAVGNRNFSVLTISATLIATFIGGEDFFGHLSEVYMHGLYYMWALILGYFLLIFINGNFLVPRMGEFSKCLSLADSMGSLYGKYVRSITAVLACFSSAGMVAVQLQISGSLVEYLFNVPTIWGIIIGGFIITLYSSFGGIKSVTLTDVLQLFTICVVIPVLIICVYNAVEAPFDIVEAVKNHELFNYKEVFDFSRPKSLKYLIIFLFIAIPGMGAPEVQRIIMSKSPLHARRSYLITSVICPLIACAFSFLAVVLMITKPGMAQNDVAKHIIFDYSFTGLKGLTLVGIMAMVMSTADSYVNATSVMMTHDLGSAFNFKFKNELLVSRLTSGVVGLIAMYLASKEGTILDLLMLSSTFNMPVITVPFIMAILGFRTTTRVVLIGMLAAVITIFAWDHFVNNPDFGALIPAMAANFLTLLIGHYLLKEPGGWVGVKDETPLIALRLRRKERIEKIKNYIKNFSIREILLNNRPKNEKLYAALALFAMASNFFSLFTLSQEVRNANIMPIGVFLTFSLLLNTSLIAFALWSGNRFVFLRSVFWSLAIFVSLIATNFFFTIMGSFKEIHMMIFLVSIIVVFSVVRWNWSIFLISLGIFLTYKISFNGLYSVEMQNNLNSMEFKVYYLTLLLSAIVVIFLRPKQIEADIERIKLDSLGEQADFSKKELYLLSSSQRRFVEEVQHEIGNSALFINLAKLIYDNYTKWDSEKVKENLHMMISSANRFYNYTSNIVNYALISDQNYKLKKEQVNISALLTQIIDKLESLFLKEIQEKSLTLKVNIAPNVIAVTDSYYLQQVFNNFITNALQYSEHGVIGITLHSTQTQVIFNIKDQSMAIDKTEMHKIFEDSLSQNDSDTKMRGISLILNKKIVQSLGGSVQLESDSGQGSSFTIFLAK